MQCEGKEYQKYCYEGGKLDECPVGAKCEYQYAGDEEDRGQGTTPISNSPLTYNTRSPFTRTHAEDEEIPEGIITSICDEYKVCGVDMSSAGYPKVCVGTKNRAILV